MIKYRIAFDINGNDNGPMAAFFASLKFAKNNPEIEIILVGNTDEIKYDQEIPSNIKLILNKNKPSDIKNIRAIIKEDFSMNQAIDLVLNKEADAIISSGDSGAYISLLTLKAKRINGISRPAFMAEINTVKREKTLFLDIGANIVVKPEYLYEWAKLTNAFYKQMHGKNDPKLTILNIGTEEYKGPELLQESAKLIKEDSSINFIGFSEPRNLLKGDYDIAICDGYAGNLILKSYEGAIFTFRDLLKESIMKKLKYKLAALLLKGAFKDTMEVLDYRNAASGWVLGVNVLAIKNHGSSDQKSYETTLEKLKASFENDLLNKLKEVANE
ncbi:phosphate acyltransferase PlsX [Mycoplasmopsis gallinacea]|uniref:Phosphate acyltransferase n=1 Tax=Mycoplasmopsis gallinacea TaxID=29556 RepID=A0A449A3E5_9BACT|nr:phosphate acyltransferase PlsX [Mycoplasmopsis gallinacea]VEU58748.1 glycerol-3-phosphate acyltransferase PlsX [Mycoplasmopsis gallinacea]